MTEVDFPRGGSKPKPLTSSEPKEKKRKGEAKTGDEPVVSFFLFDFLLFPSI